MIHYGNLFIHNELVICGHPGLCMDIYRFSIEKAGIYNVFVMEVPNDQNKPTATIIQVSMGVHPNQGKSILLKSRLSNQCHGGIMICDGKQFQEIGENFEDGINEKLWNYFANGLCLKRSWSHGTWKSNCNDGNVVFVPSDEYYDVFTCEGGFLIECNTGFDS